MRRGVGFAGNDCVVEGPQAEALRLQGCGFSVAAPGRVERVGEGQISCAQICGVQSG
jgi:hypothetical protein